MLRFLVISIRNSVIEQQNCIVDTIIVTFVDWSKENNWSSLFEDKFWRGSSVLVINGMFGETKSNHISFISSFFVSILHIGLTLNISFGSTHKASQRPNRILNYLSTGCEVKLLHVDTIRTMGELKGKLVPFQCNMLLM